MPRFSIVVPVYNAKDFIGECVASVQAQEFADFELMLVDDGSTDGSALLLDEIAARDARVKVIHQANAGVTAARLAGLSAACGEYVLNVDADDMLLPDALGRFSALIDAHAPDMIAYGYRVYDGGEKEQITNFTPAGIYEKEEKEKLLSTLICRGAGHFEGSLIYTLWSKVVRRELLLLLQPTVPREITIGEDLALCVRLTAEAGRICVSDYTGYLYRYNAASVNNNVRAKDIGGCYPLFSYLAEHVGEGGQAATYAYWMLSKLVFSFAHQFESAGEFAKRIKTLLPKDAARFLKGAALCGKEERLRHFLLTHRMYRTVYILVRMKNRRNV